METGHTDWVWSIPDLAEIIKSCGSEAGPAGDLQESGGTMKQFASEIYAAVRSRRLAEPFTAAMVKPACPGWADRTYGVFLAKHAEGNGRTTELFVRVAPGSYRLKITN